MSPLRSFVVRRLGATDIEIFRQLLGVMGRAFDEMETYTRAQPSTAYLGALLDGGSFIALAAVDEQFVVGGLAAYELQKFEQERREIYIYDLAIASEHRRKGIATALINELKSIGAARGAHIMYVQADRSDEPAVALYANFGRREDVFHFNIAVR